MMQISEALQDVTMGIGDVVELINGGGTSHFDADEIAAQYAWLGAEEHGYGMGRADFEAQLDAILDAGAEFDYSKAMEVCLAAKKS